MPELVEPEGIVERLLDARADGFALVDEAAEDNHEQWRSRFFELLFDTAERAEAPETWASQFEFWGVDPDEWIEFDARELLEIPAAERDIEWIGARNAIFAAAAEQAYAEVMLIPTLQANEQASEMLFAVTDKMSLKQLRDAPPPGKQRYESAKQRRADERNGTA